ncbi:MAG: type II toxin-antitoxin system VapC family toxin [Proteobacteria bacterium]|nr:type II toxin-antitoxin system VapC family toxin [Pseudomonadota bacterium]
MTTVLVDSNVLLDVIADDPHWFEWSSSALSAAISGGRTAINPIIFAEVSMRYSDIAEIDKLLWERVLVREPLPYEAAFLAGKIYLQYRKRGGKRMAPLPDFFIGAHAAVAGYTLLTRNPKDYRRDFPKLELIAP